MIRNPTKLLTGCDVVFHQRIVGFCTVVCEHCKLEQIWRTDQPLST